MTKDVKLAIIASFAAYPVVFLGFVAAFRYLPSINELPWLIRDSEYTWLDRGEWTTFALELSLLILIYCAKYVIIRAPQ